MAIQQAAGTLHSQFGIVPITGFHVFEVLDVDQVTGSLQAEDTTTWAELGSTTWGNLVQFSQSTIEIRTEISDFDLGEPVDFTLDIQAETQGTISYYVYTSSTGEFQGEELETLVEEGDSINSFRGQFVKIQARSSSRKISDITVTVNTEPFTQRLLAVDTSQLPGTSQARTLELATPVSGVVEITIDPLPAPTYIQDLYVTNQKTSTVLVPVVLSKTQTPQFQLVGLDNVPRDGVVDITVVGMPQMTMTDGNLVSNR